MQMTISGPDVRDSYSVITLPPLGALRAMEAAARHSSFSKAAEELCVTHSAVSHQIKLLESWFGKELFIRTGNGVISTPACSEFSKLVGDCFGLISEASNRLRRLGSAKSVRVAAIPSFATRWVIPRIPTFQREFHDIELEVCYAPQHFKGDLAGFDVVITYFDGKYVGNLHSKVLFSGALAPVCSPGYLQANGFVADIATLNQATFLHDEERSTWIAWLAAQGMAPGNAQVGTVFADFNLLSTAAIAGHGVALCPTDLIREDLDAGNLTQLFADEIFLERNYMLFRQDAPTTAAQEFCNWLVDETSFAKAGDRKQRVARS
ncbi:LysR substrate-binding domain-containing protein [Novosphingobium album (ex Liu et al. 2023)]|uniref:LysR substrate-binding domain-containing protein n=1 Tax=Novosphingobium album (ex Liu et al. 2023) TaxID=3031130 RepID=A0ABT5WJH6_9SPHN|nr:LysR substrate-binding domain-containing protein [Novosphingobium album (ex Liu et al. 2023)]MDE8650200.1 LysR substrate-binding domain-containing protein [Novosphingobium album (ex Liu et al. 2023)]